MADNKSDGLEMSAMLRDVLGTDADKLNLSAVAPAPTAKIAPVTAPLPTLDVPSEEETPATETPETPPAPEGETVFTPEQQAGIDAQLAEVRTAATAELQAKLDEQAAQLAAYVEQEGQQSFALPGDVDPLMLAVSPEPIDQFHQEFLAAERWASEHADGFNQESPDWKAGSQEWTGAQVRKMFTELKQRHDEVVPAARARLDAMMKALPEVKEKHPNLFKQNHPDQIETRRLLRAYPSLLANPRALLDLGDLLAGRRTRLAKEAAEKAKPAPGAPAPAKAAAAKPTAKPPLPGGGPSAHTPRGTKPASGSLQSGNDFQKFIASRGSGADLEKLIGATIGRG